LFEDRHPEASRLQFWTRSGWLFAERADGGYTLDFPSEPPVPAEIDPVVAKALGAPVVEALRGTDLVYVVEDARTVRDLAPDLAVLAGLDVRGVVVTAPGSGTPYDYVGHRGMAGEDFYYLALKPNGWELGKRDPSYPGGQRFLATGENAYPIGFWYSVEIEQRGATQTARVDGRRLTTFTDRERPYLGGSVGLYAEDAEAEFTDVTIEPSAATTRSPARRWSE
jgi:hypothetical protein